MVATITS